MNLAKAYTPDQYEPTIYALWEQSGGFAPTGKGTPFSVVMPPPNANGNLHIGHALDMNLKDILVRYHRMKGDDTVFIPGADHAGFETWVVYERQLEKEGKSRFDFSREQLYQQVWNYVDARRGDMELQLRALGVSASWQDLVFTLDEKVIDTVYGTFKKMWDDDLIYRGERIVNFCTKHQTSFADIEVVHKNEKSKLYKIAYPTFDKIGEIVVATTRPETIFGDVAVAVNPDDERYKKFIGTRVLLPLLDKEIPVIADEYVDKEYGTGAVKITPAHDPNDFEVAERHDLPRLTVISPEGKMENVPEQFAGLSVQEARKRVIAALEAAELLRGKTDIEHSVGHCYKCDTVIEPLLKSQWFIKVKPLTEAAIEAIKAGKINFTPENYAKLMIDYLENLRDWNISRQIPWGIPIPAFQNVADPDDWIFDERVSENTIEKDGKTYVREEDTFDTWFSSGQWPYIVTDYLSDGKLSRFFPTTLMETGYDIMRQWVSRMIMLSLYRTDQIPFENVYFHGMVNDEHNQKMSKSKGNVINPMEIVAEYGSDAMRMGIIAGRSPAQSQAFNRGAVVAARNFCNKLWNIARFIESGVGDSYQPQSPAPKTLADHWILSRLDAAEREISNLLDTYRFGDAGDAIYHAIWDDVADWYIEASKVNPDADMLVYVLETILKLAHPFAPFVTETIWQSLGWRDDILMTSSWPQKQDYDEISAAEFKRLQKLISEIRFVTAELPGNEKRDILYGDDSLIADNADLIKHHARVNSVAHTDVPRGLRLAASGRDVWVDIDAETLYEHQSNLEVRLAQTRHELKNLESRLANENYVKKAPPALVEESQKLAEQKRSQIARYVAELESIGE